MKTDAELKKDVLAELAWEPSVNAARIGVEVEEGVVTLAGHVNTYAEKWHAEEAAQRVRGVRGLAVEIDVQLANSDHRTDAQLANSVRDVLQWTTNLPVDSIRIMVESGYVTLTGAVDVDYQRRSASNALRHLIGIKGVHNELTIRPRVLSSALKSDIEAALTRRARSSAPQINVQVDGATVTLTGTAHSLPERKGAVYCAWGTPGVQKVIDHIRIVPLPA
jgi:osmotically-inducible protein OsmY